ncbi:MAG TPA: 7-cyano-7-deazaguanine synthase [Gemmataceae bacterium]|nr:7-cyano-7-deazaguanine synthase [Gemmataceae bacterium]
MSARSPVIVACNGASFPKGVRLRRRKPIRLEYRRSPGREGVNVKLLLPDFVRQVIHLPDRVLDLLEIAAYVFAADRFTTRGAKDAVEYNAWPRSFHFAIKVRDHSFWRDQTVRDKLSAALLFMSGDEEYRFTFQPGHKTPPASFFDQEEFLLDPEDDVSVMLFSGGLDSLAGAVDHFARSGRKLCLVSHRSGQPGTARTQDALVNALGRAFRGRLMHYRFHCGLTGRRANEETQRTRSFLYASTAYALAHALSVRELFVCENGITAMNFIRRQDLMNARASRTAHPKTLGLLGAFLSEVAGKPMRIETPFLWKTKADVLQLLEQQGQMDLLTSTVSCGKTFQNLGPATHCGGCSQCIDRRFAAYASGLQDVDVGIYATDFIAETVTDREVKTTLVDYVRQAVHWATWNVDHFYRQMLLELADLEGHVPGASEEAAVESVRDLCRRHGLQVLEAMKRMRGAHDDLAAPLPEGSFLQMMGAREYLKEPVRRLVDAICDRLRKAIRLTFHSNPPKDEKDFKDKVSGILAPDQEQLDREHPAVAFALGHVVPDHSSRRHDLFIEYKYIRGKTSPSKVSEGIAADLVKYPADQHVLFVIYDPSRSIADDDKFKQDFESKGPCTVFIIR